MIPVRLDSLMVFPPLKTSARWIFVWSKKGIEEEGGAGKEV